MDAAFTFARHQEQTYFEQALEQSLCEKYNDWLDSQEHSREVRLIWATTVDNISFQMSAGEFYGWHFTELEENQGTDRGIFEGSISNGTPS